MPRDDLLPQHVGQTQQQGQGTDLTHSTGTVGMVAQEEVERRRQLVEQRGIAALDGLLHDSQRSSTCLGIQIAGQLAHLRPGGHLCGEGHQQGGTTHEGRIEEVITQTTKRHLGNTDGKQRTDDDDPDGEVGGKVEAEQQTCQDGRAVADGVALALEHKLVDGPLKEHAGRNARCTDDGRTKAKEVERHQ